MSLKFYERGYYIGHNHGITGICLKYDIGEIRFQYQEVPSSYVESTSKDEVADLFISGEVIRRKIKGAVKDFFSEPLTAYIHLSSKDVDKLNDIKSENENVAKFIEYTKVNKREDYVLDVEIRRPH